jgi:aryl-alcohol dehydrogenase-like predicted oxidoreductase
MATETLNDDSAGTIGDLEVRRLGYGAMRITGEGIWGPPQDRDGALAVLRRAVELGIGLIDTANSYGPDVSEELIAEALYPYPEGLVIATKGGLERTGPGEWSRNGRPEHLREVCEGSLRRLRLERIDVYQLHSVDPDVPYEESVGALKELQDEGKIRHIGISNVGLDDLATAREMVEVVSVQNRFNLGDRDSADVLDRCEADGIAFIPGFRSTPAPLPSPAAPRRRSPSATARPRPRSRLPGYCRHSTPPFQFRAPPPSPTSKKTSPPRHSS